ncbi:MAG: hypothetical protein ACQESB_01755 [Elusimicrobiota bacterium]
MEFLKPEDTDSISSIEEFEDEMEGKDELEFDRELFDRIRREKDQNIYTEPEVEDTIVDDEDMQDEEEEYPTAMPDLPYEARLKISGRKSISLKMGHSFFLGDEEDRTLTGAPPGISRGFEMDQELRVRIQGQVGDKITVDVDYDDTKPDYNEDARRISVVYKGDPDEIIKEAAFGDISLRLPSTHFTGYSRSAFGAKVEGSYKNIDFMAIASQTKGKTEVKEFSGDTTFTRREIKDIDYIRRRYYNINIDTTAENIAIEPGSVRVFVRDGEADTGIEGVEVKYYQSSEIVSGTFHELVAGRDFTVDHLAGTLILSSSLQSNHVAAVSYEYEGGEVGEDYPVIFADEQEELGKKVTKYELKNRYNLGASRILRDDFIIRFMDTNRETVTFPDISYDIDYDRGIIKFQQPQPFDPDGEKGIYDPNDYQDAHHYIIYAEFRSRIKQYSLRPNIVRGSERIVKDGVALERNTDYLIDYPSGFLTFLRPEEIDETTKIRATYEYMPFAMAQQETLVGLRSDFKASRNLNIGGTFLYNFSAAEREIPRVGQTPRSAMLVGGNFDLKIPVGTYNPFPSNLSGEIARSQTNPNTIGKAMIDDMDGIRRSRSVSMRKDEWQIASTPGSFVASPSWVNLEEEDDKYLSDINPLVPLEEDERVRIIEVDYDIPGSDMQHSQQWENPEVSIVNPISRTGIDLSEMDKIQMWFKGDLRDAHMDIEFGVISEDADNTGIIKPQPDNIEDSRIEGWPYTYPGETSHADKNPSGWHYDYISDGEFVIGADNGRIDTNDLDRDGEINTTENTVVFSTSSVNYEGWTLLEFDVSEEDRLDMRFVKHVRLTIRNSKGSRNMGNISMSRLQATGNYWRSGVVLDNDEDNDEYFRLNDVNTFDDPEYDSPKELEIYDEIYAKVGGRDITREGSLELLYNLTSSTYAYAYMTFPQALDFSTHKELNFLLNGSYASPGTVFFVEFGAGDNYFRKEIEVDFNGWEKVSISLEDKELEKIIYKGEPSIANIREIRLGLSRKENMAAEGKVWVNVLHLDSVLKHKGSAERFKFSSSIPGILKYDASYTHITEDFQKITEPTQNQKSKSYSANATLIAFPFLPLRGSYSLSETITPADRISDDERNPYISARDEGKVKREEASLNADLKVSGFPDVKARYSESISKSDLTGRFSDEESVSGSFSYSPPLDIFLVPGSLSGSARRTLSEISWDERIIGQREEGAEEGGDEDWSETTLDFTARASFNMFDIISLDPSYSKNIKDRTRDFYTGPYSGEEKKWPWSRKQSIDLNSNIGLVHWLRPSFSYSVNTEEQYNFRTENKMDLFEETKNVNRNFDINSGLSLGVKNILPGFDPVETLEIDFSYSFEKGEIYKEIESSLSVFDRLHWKKDIDTPDLDSATTVHTRRLSSDWKPFDFMNLSGIILKSIEEMRLRSKLQLHNRKEINDSSAYEEHAITWPDLTADFGRIPSLPYTNDIITDINIRGEYKSNRETDYSYVEGEERFASHGVKENVRKNYAFNSKFRVYSNYDAFVEYKRESTENIDLRAERWSSRSENKKYNSQVKFALREYWDIIARLNYSCSEKIAYPDIVRADSKKYESSLGLSAVIDLPDLLTLPLIGDISAGNRMKLNGDLRAEFSRSELDVYRTNTNKYGISGSGQLDVAANMRGSFGLGLDFVHNIKRFANSYAGFHFQTEVSITF